MKAKAVKSIPKTQDASEMELSDGISQLAVMKVVLDDATEIYKAHEAKVKAQFMETYADADGARKDSSAFGRNAYLTKCAGRKTEAYEEPLVKDSGALDAWISATQNDILADFARSSSLAFARYMIEEHGAIPDGVELVRVEATEKPPYAMLKIKRAEVEESIEEMTGARIDAMALLPSIADLQKGGDEW